jgi:serine/threonine protein phosphatase PrpC
MMLSEKESVSAMPDPVSGRVFISYRRQDARGSAGRIYDRLADRFGSDRIFMDVDNLPPGADFNKVINEAVSKSRVLLAIIGPHWLDAKERRRRRLDDPGDLVRMEIAAALERDTLVIPILVEDVPMPRRHELPENLAGLAGRNAHRVRHESFRSDVETLLAAIEAILRAEVAPVASATQDQAQQEPKAPPGRRRPRTPPRPPVEPSRAPGERIRLSYIALSSVAVARLGPRNEDSFFVGRTVFAVADGQGGWGDLLASNTAVELLAALDGRDFADPGEAAEALAAVIREANSAILEWATTDPSLSGIGTTLTAAAQVGERHLQLAHVGNSRAYLLRDGTLEQLTTDHTAVAELVLGGHLTPTEAAIHPERSILTRAVGHDVHITVDTPDPLELRAGDQVLLCSDGLTEMVDDDRIAALLATPNKDWAVQTLIDAANDAGGTDTITLVLLRVEASRP